jgi:RNA polymerase II C-terminal domain phosphatase-like 1/2
LQARASLAKLQKLLEESKASNVDDSDASGSSGPTPTQKRITILTEEISILEQDLKMIREYIETDKVTDENGDEHVAQLEAAFTDPCGKEDEIERPVIRLMRGEDYVTVFTRIDPENTNTSMIIRVRAGWEKLKQELMATTLETTGIRKWDTYVCTAAEMRYALEVRNP